MTVYRNVEDDYIMVFENEAEMPNVRTHVVSMQRHGFMFLTVALTILAFVINRFCAMRINKSIVRLWIFLRMV